MTQTDTREESIQPALFNAPKPGLIYYEIMDSDIGPILLTGDGESLTGLHQTSNDRVQMELEDEWKHDPAPFGQIMTELDEYFSGSLFTFNVPLAPRGTAFQLDVWRALMEVPYAKTASYGDIARAVGRPRASRAVGGANHNNPISVIIPCHRIIGSTGSLTGYGFGLDRKEQLLELERLAWQLRNTTT